MSTALNNRPQIMPWKDPLQAEIPTIRDGCMSAVYYGQRQSGDFYDFLRVTAGRVLFGLFDVAGDLQQTRPIVLALQKKFRGCGQQLFSGQDVNVPEAMEEFWIQLNKAVMKAAGGVRSCPAFLGCYNEEIKTLCYVNAGHIPAIMRDGGQTRELGATSLPLGLFSHSVPDSSVIALGPRDVVLLVSKGIVEAKHRGEEYGIERAKDYLRETGFETAHETCVSLLSRVRQFMGTAPTHNDVTVLSLVRTI